MINDSQLKALEALKTFRYLTVKQFVKLGIYKSEKGLRDKVLARLRLEPYPLISSTDFGFVAGKGRLESVHCLTKRGALVLADLDRVGLEAIPYPTGAIQFSRDYEHRLEFISLHIALRQYAERTGQTVDFFHSYFDSVGNQRQKNSQLIRSTQVFLGSKAIIPDGNFRLAMLDGQTRLFSLELHKGNNTAKILEQLENHAVLIEKELLPKKYNHPFDNYVLSVYDHQGTLEAVKKRFQDSARFKQYQAHYAFNLWEVAQTDFAQGWHYCDGQAFNVFSEKM